MAAPPVFPWGQQNITLGKAQDMSRKPSYRGALVAASAVSALLAWSPAAHAQSVVEEVVVTAQKRA